MPTFLYYPEWTEFDQGNSGNWLEQKAINNAGSPLPKALPQVRASNHSTGNALPGGALADLRQGDTVYVVMHGAPEMNYVSANYANGRQAKYSARALALHMQREGLPQAILRIKMWSCGSGLGAQPFALSLKHELFRLGYVHLTLYGYAAESVSNKFGLAVDENGQLLQNFHKAAWNTGATYPYTRAKLARVQY